MEKIYNSNTHQKKDGMAILISDNVDFRRKNITRDHEDHFKMINKPIHNKDITILNVYAPKNGV